MIDFEIVIPVYNEENQVESSILKLREFLKVNFAKDSWRVTVADNASTDKTPEIVEGISKKISGNRIYSFGKKGTGTCHKKSLE